MKLDIRWPIGLMFTIVGALLVAQGLFADESVTVRAPGIKINLWWGLVLLVFGVAMLWLSHAGRSKGSAAPK